MTAAELTFRRICEAKSLASAVRDLGAAELADLIEWLEGRDLGEVTGEVWATCMEEVKVRWIKLMKGDRQG